MKTSRWFYTRQLKCVSQSAFIRFEFLPNHTHTHTGQISQAPHSNFKYPHSSKIATVYITVNNSLVKINQIVL